MKIKDVIFYKSVDTLDEKVFFDERKEIVFIGRSNVGKSSLMNAIFNTKDLVHTSSKPGKTRRANMFLVNNKYYFTDLPWYGFAKMGKEQMEKIDGLISWYLEERKNAIKQVVLIVDTKIGAQESDLAMYKFLEEMKIPKCIALSKVDRLSNNEIKKSLDHSQEIFFGQKIIPISTFKNVWIKELLLLLGESLKG